MSFCRHILLRIHVPRSLPTPFLYKRHSSDSSDVRLVVRRGALAVATQSTKKSTEDSAADSLHGEGVSPDITSQEAAGAVLGGSAPSANRMQMSERTLGRGRQSSDAPATEGTRAVKPFLRSAVISKHEGDGSAQAALQFRAQVQSYKKLREVGGSLATSHTIKEFNQILSLAVQKFNDLVVVKMLAEDVIQAAPRAQLTVLASMVQKLLRILAFNPRALPKTYVLRLLQALSARQGGLAALDPKRRPHFAKIIMSLPADPELDEPLRELIVTMLSGLVVDPAVETSEARRTISESCIWLLYRLALDFVQGGRPERALDIVGVLAKTCNVPASAIRQADLQSGNFQFIVLSAAIRSCMQWGWRDRGKNTLIASLSSDSSISHYLAELAAVFAAFLLDPPKSGDIKSVASILIQLVTRGPKNCIPDRVLQDFYDAAFESDAPSLVEAVYAEIRKRAALDGHSYSPPTRNAYLLKFMRFLFEKSRNVHLARELTAQAVKDEFSPSPGDRAEFIALAAEQGFALSARMLWERWSAPGRHRRILVSNSATMVRMVSLFASLAGREEVRNSTEGSPSRSASPTGASATLSPRAAPVADVDTQLSVEEPTLEISDGADAENGPSALERANASEMPDAVGSTLFTNSSATRDDSLRELPSQDPAVSMVEESTTREAQTTADEYRAFAMRVLKEYRSTRVLSSMTHHDLNAYARACFILKHTTDGFEAFYRLLRKRQIPDVQDVNVLLSFLAEYNPANAAQVIERMIRSGMQPDQVTFGTVIHHAAIHGDADLVERLTLRARGLGIEALDLKTAGSLIRSIIATHRPETSRWTQLAMIQKLVRSLQAQDQVPSPNIARDCIIAALRADDVRAAFRFWNELVKDKVQWDDDMEKRTRRRIATRVREHLRHYRLSVVAAGMMFRELEDGDVTETSLPADDTEEPADVSLDAATERTQAG